MEQEIIQETQVRERMMQDTFTRNAKIETSNVDVEARTVELSFASEHPVERYFGLEILEMSSRAADLNRLNTGGALLSDHDTRGQIGAVVKAWVGDDKRGHAIVKFSRSQRGQEEFQDVIDGIRTNVSFGYRIQEHNIVRGEGNAPDKVNVTRWEAFEISLVAIPADASVGVGRELENLGSQESERTEEKPVETPVELITENKQERSIQVENTEQTQATTATFSRENQILEYGKMFGEEALARQFAADPNKAVADLQRALADKYKPTAETISPSQAAEVGLTEKEVRQYSISNAILAAADGKWDNAGFERECSDAIAQKLGRDSGGFFVPSEVQTAKRDLSVVGGLTAGGALVGTDHMPGSFIEFLRSKTKMLQLGVSVMSGLVGNPSVPRQDGAGTGYWVAEGVAPTESNQVFGQLGMSPKTCGAVTEFTRQLLIQSAPTVDGLVYADIAAVLARTIDSAIIQGSGVSGQPTGILNTTGVSEVSMIGGSFAFADAVAFETAIEEADAPDGVSWLCRPSVKGVLKSRPKIGSTYPVYLLEGKQMNGYNVEATTQMPASTLIFGAYSTIILGEWGVLEIEANRLGSGFRAGNIEVRGLHMVDVAVRYPQALKKLTAFA
jgi:HK97 family phage major capsid protein